MKEDIEFYINENGVACVPLNMYNDSLEEIEKLHSIIKEVREKIEDEIERATNSIYIELDEDTYIKMFKKYLQILDKEK